MKSQGKHDSGVYVLNAGVRCALGNQNQKTPWVSLDPRNFKLLSKLKSELSKQTIQIWPCFSFDRVGERLFNMNYINRLYHNYLTKCKLSNSCGLLWSIGSFTEYRAKKALFFTF